MTIVKGVDSATNSAGTAISGVSFVAFVNPATVNDEVLSKVAQLAVRIMPISSGDPLLAAFRVVVSSSLPVVTRAAVAITGAGVGAITPFSGDVSALSTSPEPVTGNNFTFTVARPVPEDPPGGITVIATAIGAKPGTANAEVPPQDYTAAEVETIVLPTIPTTAEIETIAEAVAAAIDLTAGDVVDIVEPLLPTDQTTPWDYRIGGCDFVPREEGWFFSRFNESTPAALSMPKAGVANGTYESEGLYNNTFEFNKTVSFRPGTKIRGFKYAGVAAGGGSGYANTLKLQRISPSQVVTDIASLSLSFGGFSEAQNTSLDETTDGNLYRLVWIVQWGATNHPSSYSAFALYHAALTLERPELVAT